jgi:hypothetical protein
MDKYQLGWQDPIDQLHHLRVAVRHLTHCNRTTRERFGAASEALAKYWRMPERLKNRRDNIMNTLIAVRKEYDTYPWTRYRFDLLSAKERRALEDDFFALYEACLLDMGRMREVGGLAAHWYDIMYPKDAEPRTVKPRTDPSDNLPPFTGLRVIDDVGEI